MTSPQQTSPDELPSSARLRRATLVAVGVAALLLVTVVMPAEYGKDPTGIGRLLGLTEMGEIKQQLAQEAAAAAPAASSAPSPSPSPTRTASPSASFSRADTVLVSLAQNEGKEVKLVMLEGASATFSWRATGGGVNFDQHGDSTAAPNSYIGYERGTNVEADSGVMTAAMDGGHGWFWRNRSGRPVVVRLIVSGDYSELKKFF